MSDAVLAALITGSLALVGVIITTLAAQRKTQTALQETLRDQLAAIRVDIATTKTEVKDLRIEVAKHNNFAERVPALEAAVQQHGKEIERLENFHME